MLQKTAKCASADWPSSATARSASACPSWKCAWRSSRTVDRRPAFREYIVREHVPNYTIEDQVIVGGVLPETGVTYYDVPQSFGMTPYRYTVVNGQTILVEPRSRRIVQVVD